MMDLSQQTSEKPVINIPIPAGLVLPPQDNEAPLEDFSVLKLDGKENRAEARAKQFQQDVQTLADANTPDEERAAARRRIINMGSEAIVMLDEELKTARGDTRNELLRLRAPAALEAATQFGRELIELDFRMTSDRATHISELFKAMGPNVHTTVVNGHVYGTVGQKEGAAVFAAFCKGLAESREVTGAPKMQQSKVDNDGYVHSEAIFNTKDGRRITLTMVHRPDNHNPAANNCRGISVQVDKVEKDGATMCLEQFRILQFREGRGGN